MPRRKASLSDAEIEALLERFVRGDMRVDEGEMIIQRFRWERQQVLPHLLQMIGDPDENTHAAAAELLMALEDRSVVRPLLDLLDDPTLSDWSKLSVFSVLQRYDVPVDLEALYRRLRDPEAVARRSEENLLDSFTYAAELAQFLQALTDNMAPDERAEMVYRLAETGDSRVLLPLRAALHVPEESTVLAAIDGLNTLRAVPAIPWLEKLAQYGPTEAIRREAGKVAGHLTMRSSVPGAALLEDMPALAEAELPLYRCWLSTIDGAGGQIALAARQREDGYLVVADVMFTDREGIRDCLGSDMMSQEELADLRDGLVAEGIATVEVTLARCREAARAALEQTLAVGRRVPLEYLAWDGVMAGEDSQLLKTRTIAEVDIITHPELLAGSIRCLALPEMASWFLSPDEIRPFAKPREHFFLRRLASPARIMWILRQGLESIFDTQRRALLSDRLRRQAWLLAQIYTEPQIWQWIMAASAGLGDPGVPSGQHPLLLGMMAAGLDELMGTTFLDELLTWPEGIWLDIVRESPTSVHHSGLSERAKLLHFLEETDLEVPPALTRLLAADEPKAPSQDPEQIRTLVRALNAIESTLDEEIDFHLLETGGLDWQQLRRELGLVPALDMRSSFTTEIEAALVEGMEHEGCPQEMVSRAQRLWEDYILVTQGQIQPLRKPTGWAAGVMYLAHQLRFEWQTQAEAGELYGVSAATVGSRYQTLRDELGVDLFGLALSKRWQAVEKVMGQGDLTGEELARRLMSRFQDGGKTQPGGHGE